MIGLDLIKYEIIKQKKKIIIIVMIFFILGILYGFDSMEVRKIEPSYRIEARVAVVNDSLNDNSIDGIAEYMKNDNIIKKIANSEEINSKEIENKIFTKVYTEYDYMDVIVIASSPKESQNILNKVLLYGINDVESTYHNIKCNIIKITDVTKVSVTERSSDIIAQNNYSGLDRYDITEYVQNEMDKTLPIKMGISTVVLGSIFTLVIFLCYNYKNILVKTPLYLKEVYDLEMLAVFSSDLSKKGKVNLLVKNKIKDRTLFFIIGSDNAEVENMISTSLLDEYNVVEFSNKNRNNDHNKVVTIADNQRTNDLISLVNANDNVILVVDFYDCDIKALDAICDICKEMNKEISGLIFANVPQRLIDKNNLYLFKSNCV